MEASRNSNYVKNLIQIAIGHIIEIITGVGTVRVSVRVSGSRKIGPESKESKIKSSTNQSIRDQHHLMNRELSSRSSRV